MPITDATNSGTCKSCKGSGKHVSPAFTSVCGHAYPERISTCCACKGEGIFLPVDADTILAQIKGRAGLRTKRPESNRAYYVWRMARFHGGVDVTMPVVAMTVNDGDPFKPELDALSDVVAKTVYGTSMAAAYRWAPLLVSGIVPPKGLPATAYACGPVATQEKPEIEALEAV